MFGGATATVLVRAGEAPAAVVDLTRGAKADLATVVPNSTARGSASVVEDWVGPKSEKWLGSGVAWTGLGSETADTKAKLFLVGRATLGSGSASG
jgi:hypothetical protein